MPIDPSQRERVNLGRMPASYLRMVLGDTSASVRRRLSIWMGLSVTGFVVNLIPAIPGSHGLGQALALLGVAALSLAGWLRADELASWLYGE